MGVARNELWAEVDGVEAWPEELLVVKGLNDWRGLLNGALVAGEANCWPPSRLGVGETGGVVSGSLRASKLSTRLEVDCCDEADDGDDDEEDDDDDEGCCW